MHLSTCAFIVITTPEVLGESVSMLYCNICFTRVYIEGSQPEWCISSMKYIVEIYHSGRQPWIYTSTFVVKRDYVILQNLCILTVKSVASVLSWFVEGCVDVQPVLTYSVISAHNQLILLIGSGCWLAFTISLFVCVCVCV